ncbi:MAG: M64 family metallopeptidase [Bacteroidales bacterium]|nr:M64 family metallopeptidase [Bacteroidales bacterium]
MCKVRSKLAVRIITVISLISFYTGINSEIFCQYADIVKDPLEWLCEPYSVFSTEVRMSVKIPLTDAELEYKFDCVEGKGYSSDWQSSNEFKNSDLIAETSYSYIARVRMFGSSSEFIPSTGEYRVTSRRSTNTEKSRYIPEIDRAFANGEIELIPIRVTGDKDNRINFCAINRWVEGKEDGYNDPALREEFIEDARHSFRTFIPGDEYAIAPYPEYRDFFNLYAIWWPGMPAYNWKEGLTTVDLDEIRDRLFLPWNIEGRGWVSCLAMLNTDKGGGGAARNIETRTGNAMIAGNETEGFIHEFSHTAPGLPDEYTSNGVWGRGGEGSNTTLDFIRDDVKWRAWIEPDTEVPTPYSPENIDKIGVFEGATHRLHHIYRPTARACIMGAGSFTGDPDGLCPICVQRTICRLYMWVNPFDSKYPARDELKLEIPGKVHFVVKPIRTLSGSQKLNWFLNGEDIAGDVTELDLSFEANTEYELECRLVDETDMVRPDLPYVDFPRASVKWIINKSSQEREIFVGGHNKSFYETAGSTEQTKAPDTGGHIALSIAEITPSTGSMNNGSIKLVIDGAKAPYTLYWSDGLTTEESYRNFLIPGTYSVEIKDAGDSQAYLEFEIKKAPEFYVKDLKFENAGKRKIRIKNPKSEYSYLWYEEDIPDYVPVFPNGKYYGSGVSATGKEFKAVATVVENRGGVFIKDTAKNNFGSWIHLKVFQNGDNELPLKFSIDTEQEERFSTMLTIKDQKTNKITYDDNFQFSTEEVDITWNGLIRDGYMEIKEKGYLDSNIKLFYSSTYKG